MSARQGLDDLLELGLPPAVAVEVEESLDSGCADGEFLNRIQGSPVLLLVLLNYASYSYYHAHRPPEDALSAVRCLGGERARRYLGSVLQLLPPQPLLPLSSSLIPRLRSMGLTVLQHCPALEGRAAATLLRLLELVPLLTERRGEPLPQWKTWGDRLFRLLTASPGLSPALGEASAAVADPASAGVDSVRQDAAALHLALARGLSAGGGKLGNGDLDCEPQVWSILDLQPWSLGKLLEEAEHA